MLDAAFPWDVSITALSTLAAGFGAAVWATKVGARAERERWHLDRQADAASNLLNAWAAFYLSLGKAANDGRSSLDAHGNWLGPVVPTEDWNQALETLTLVGNARLVQAAHQLDAEMWRMNTRVARLGELANDGWLEHTKPVLEARVAFVNATREVLGSGTYVSATWGKPPPDDQIWQASFWDNERKRVLTARNRAGGPLSYRKSKTQT